MFLRLLNHERECPGQLRFKPVARTVLASTLALDNGHSLGSTPMVPLTVSLFLGEG